MELPPPDPAEITAEEVLQALAADYAQLRLEYAALRVAHAKLVALITVENDGRQPTPSSPSAPETPA